MTTDLRLVGLKYLDEKTNTDFLIAYEVDNPQPGGICQGAKEQLAIKRLRFPAHNDFILTQIYVLTYIRVRVYTAHSFA